MKFREYLAEKKRFEVIVKVTDKKTGSTIMSMDSNKFLKAMEKEFKKSFKFVKDAIDFLNKEYKDYHAEQIIE